MRECTQSRHHDAGRQDTRLHQSSRTRTCRRNQPISATIRPCVQVEACGPITVTHNHGGMVPQQRKTGHITREATTLKKVQGLTSRIRASGPASTWRIYRRRICKCQSESTCHVTQHIVSDQAPPDRRRATVTRGQAHKSATRAVKLNLTHSIDSSYVSG